jgi:hypothetical protein
MGLFDIFRKQPKENADAEARPVGAPDDLEQHIRKAMREQQPVTPPEDDIRAVRDTPWGPARPYWVVDSDGFRRSFAQLPYGTNLHLKLHGEGGDKGKARRVRVSRNDKTVGYLGTSMSQRYLPVVQYAETSDAELTVSGVVAEYRGEISLTVFLPAPEAMENVIRQAVAAAASG